MGGMDIILVAKADDLPARTLSAPHGQPVKVAEERTVDGMLFMALLKVLICLVDALR